MANEFDSIRAILQILIVALFWFVGSRVFHTIRHVLHMERGEQQEAVTEVVVLDPVPAR